MFLTVFLLVFSKCFKDHFQGQSVFKCFFYWCFGSISRIICRVGEAWEGMVRERLFFSGKNMMVIHIQIQINQQMQYKILEIHEYDARVDSHLYLTVNNHWIYHIYYTLWFIFKYENLREVEELRARTQQMEKTMRWVKKILLCWWRWCWWRWCWWWWIVEMLLSM